MKRINAPKFHQVIITVFLLMISTKMWAQSSNYTYNIYCSNISTTEASNNVKEYLLTNYSDRIVSYVADLDAKSANITTNLQAIDLLQLYRMQGYIAIYQNEDGRYQLNDGGDQMILIKQ